MSTKFRESFHTLTLTRKTLKIMLEALSNKYYLILACTCAVRTARRRSSLSRTPCCSPWSRSCLPPAQRSTHLPAGVDGLVWETLCTCDSSMVKPRKHCSPAQSLSSSLLGSVSVPRPRTVCAPRTQPGGSAGSLKHGHSTVHYSTVECSTVQCSTVLDQEDLQESQDGGTEVSRP